MLQQLMVHHVGAHESLHRGIGSIDKLVGQTGPGVIAHRTNIVRDRCDQPLVKVVVVTEHKISRTEDGLVVKQYRPNPGDLPRREWRALQLLHTYAPGLAPEPVAANLDEAPESITMTALPGEPLGGRPLSQPEMRAIAAALDQMHTCVPQDVLADVPLTFDAPSAPANFTSRLTTQPRPEIDPIATRAYDEALRWLSGSEANSLVNDQPHRAVLARGDHNLTNFLHDGHRVRLVDFEYSGRADRCAEMAELIEHISARCTPDHAWQRFLDELDLSLAERQRILTIRRFLVIMWLTIVMPGQEGERRNPPGTLRKQAQRTLDLLNS